MKEELENIKIYVEGISKMVELLLERLESVDIAPTQQEIQEPNSEKVDSQSFKGL